MNSNKAVTKLEDCESDSEYGDEDEITLYVSHLEDENFLTTESEEENPKLTPVKNLKAKKAKTDDCRSVEVLKLQSDNFRIKKWSSSKGAKNSQVIFRCSLLP